MAIAVRWRFAAMLVTGGDMSHGSHGGDEGSTAGLSARIEQLEQAARVDHEVIAHLESEGVIDRGKIANLEQALVTCRRIGAAIGIVMATRKVAEEQAFDALRVASQQTNRKLRDVADEVLLTGVLD